MVTLATVDAALGEYAEAFDASRLTCGMAARIVEDAARIEARAAAIKMQAAARMAEGDGWRVGGALSPAHHVARTTGDSLGRAKQVLATGQRMADLPLLAAAAARGELSATQQSIVADGASADPNAERRLVRVAKNRSVGELREEVARVKAAAEPDLEARRRRIHANRGMRVFTDTDGVGHLNVTDNPEKIATFTAHFAPERERLFQAARVNGRSETSEALDWDALYNTVCGPADVTADTTHCRAKVDHKVIVRIDADALLRGYPIAGETCEIAGVGPIAVSAVDEILTGGGFLAAVLTKAEQVAGVAHLGRHVSAKMQTAFEWLYPSCAAEGCNNSKRLERDHRFGHEFAATKMTVSDYLDGLCGADHDLKTHSGWALVDGVGKRAFVPPDDSRHPKWKRGTA